MNVDSKSNKKKSLVPKVIIQYTYIAYIKYDNILNFHNGDLEQKQMQNSPEFLKK